MAEDEDGYFPIVCMKHSDSVVCVEDSAYYKGRLLDELDADGVNFDDKYETIKLPHQGYYKLHRHNHHIQQWSKSDVERLAKDTTISDLVTPVPQGMEPMGQWEKAE